MLALTAALAIVVRDHAPLRSAPRSGATELETLWQGDVLEVRGAGAGYLKVYDYAHERGGYLNDEAAQAVGVTEADAPELLAVLRFLRDRPGSEALGISYGAAYLRAVPARALTAEPFDAIAGMAERLAARAAGSGTGHPELAAHLAVVEQFGVHMVSFERFGRVQVCYDGELYRRVLAVPGASAAARARAALGLTRPECIDPAVGAALRTPFDAQRRAMLEGIDERELTPMLRSRLHARRAAVWAASAWDAARHGEPAAQAAQRAVSELLAVRPADLGEARQAEYLDALVRVGAVRWAAAPPAAKPGTLTLSSAAGEPGQTCVAVSDARRPAAVLVRRCTYGVVWLASAQQLAPARALVLAVQPLETWRELWVFHESPSGWAVDVLSPGLEEPEEGYLDFAGFAPGTHRLLVAREVKERGHFRRRFEEVQLDDLALVRQASSPELLADFGRWQDPGWRRDTLSLH